MEENYANEVKESKGKRNTFFYIIIIQLITVAILLGSIVCMKYFFKSNYKEFNNWYEKTFLSQTDINEVLGETKNEIQTS